ncbi:MAG: hypothetical protein HZA24_09305 [Nitrospirae bacterium]|nr:hypothetical protein [Nitrospirota bacterium]
MIRLIALILAFSTLSAGAAWALDTHLESLVGHVQAYQAPLGHAGPSADKAPCDHCCHASAHLMGIPVDGKGADCPPIGRSMAGHPDGFASANPDPTTPPPLG